MAWKSPQPIEILSSAFAFSGQNKWGIISASLDMKVKYPRMVMNDQSFTVALEVSGRDGEFMWESDSDRMTRPPLNPSEDIMQMMIDNYIAQNVAFSLSLSGAEVQPTGAVYVGDLKKALWWVRAKEAGSYVGFIRPEFPSSVGGYAGEHHVQFTANDYLPISIQSRERVFTIKNLISCITVFFGSLLTLPGLIAFFKERKTRRSPDLGPSSNEGG